MNDFSLRPTNKPINSQRAIIVRRVRRKISNNIRFRNWYKRFYSFLEFKTSSYKKKISAKFYIKYFLISTLFYLFLTNKFRVKLEFGKQLNSNEMVKMSSTAALPLSKDSIINQAIPGPSLNFEHLFQVNINDDDGAKAKKRYIKRFHKVARDEMKKFGIPASIKMAQALLESNAGQSNLSLKNNNHFGIKCFSKNCIKGHCSNFHDDHHKDFFRNYKTSWDSWRAHSRFLSSDRYNHLKKHKKDYKQWAHGLKKAGYATDNKYPEKLIQLIEDFKLYALDI